MRTGKRTQHSSRRARVLRKGVHRSAPSGSRSQRVPAPDPFPVQAWGAPYCTGAFGPPTPPCGTGDRLWGGHLLALLRLECPADCALGTTKKGHPSLPFNLIPWLAPNFAIYFQM